MPSSLPFSFIEWGGTQALPDCLSEGAFYASSSVPAACKLSAKSLPTFGLSLPSVLQTWLPMWLSEILRVPRLIPPGGEQDGAGELFFSRFSTTSRKTQG